MALEIGNLYEKTKHIDELMAEQKENIIGRFGKPPELPLKTMPNMTRMLWGLRRKKLIAVGARPGNGKSAFLLQCAWDLSSQGNVVHFYSFEMAMSDCADRLFCMQSRIDNISIAKGNVSREVLERVENKVKDFKLRFFEGVGNCLPDIDEIYEKHMEKPDVVIIDYGNMVADQQYKSKKQVFDEYIKGLRSLAVNKNMCVIMAAQINRNVRKDDGKVRLPELEDFKETGVIEEVADVCVLLHWPSKYSDDVSETEYIIRVAKNRAGRAGKIPARFDAEFFTISEDEAKIEEINKARDKK